MLRGNSKLGRGMTVLLWWSLCSAGTYALGVTDQQWS